MFDLTALVTLRSVAAHGSVAAAADALGYTPSAVSQQIKRLERSSGVRLVDKAGRGITLTAEGRMLVDEGGAVISDLEELSARLRHAAGVVGGHVRLIGLSSGLCGIAAPALASLRGYPELVVTMREVEPWPAVEQVASGVADVAIVASWGNTHISIPHGVLSQVLLHDRADLLVHRDHALAQRAEVRVADLVNESWVATPPGTICRNWLERMFAGTGHSPRVTHVANEYAVHQAMVAAGNAIALVPRMGRSPLADTVRAVALSQPTSTREVSVIWRRSQEVSPAVTAVIAALRTAAATV